MQKTNHGWLFMLAVVFLASMVLVSCGSGSRNPGANVTFTALSPLAASPQASPSRTQPVVTPTTSPTATATASPTPAAADSKTAAFNAALTLLNAVPASDCSAKNPSGKACLNWSTTASTPALGVAAFNLGSPDGGAALMVLGLESDGHTWGRWFGTQQQLYQAVALPAAMIVCGGGKGITEHTQPSDSSAAVQSIPDGTTVRAEQFVLTAPGSGGSSGHGWYRLSSPADGWAPADALSVASLGDCSLHDALQGNTFDRG